MTTKEQTIRDTRERNDQEPSAGEKTAEKLGEMRDRIGEYTQETLETARRLEARFEDVVRERPLTSLLIAAGVSAAVGALIGYFAARD